MLSTQIHPELHLQFAIPDDTISLKGNHEVIKQQLFPGSPAQLVRSLHEAENLAVAIRRKVAA